MKKTIFILAMLLLLPQLSISAELLRTISVNGYAIKTLPAEYAEIHSELKVVTSSVNESYQSVTAVISELAIKLQELNLTKEDLTVSIITQGAEYAWANNTRTIKGYFSACSLRMKIESIETIYRIHEELAKYPEIKINMTTYGRNDESTLRIEALQEALLASQEKAKAMTEALGSTLGPVVNIRESGTTVAPVGRQVAQFTDRAPGGRPEEVSTTGSVTVRGDVTVDYEIR